jgi:hypothetical protein
VAPELEGSSPHSQEPVTGPYPAPAESTAPPPQPVFLTSILIPSSHLRLGLPSGPFPTGFPTKTLFTFLSHVCHMPRPPHSPWFRLPNDIWGWIQNMKLLTVFIKYDKLKNSLGKCSFISYKCIGMVWTACGSSSKQTSGNNSLASCYFRPPLLFVTFAGRDGGVCDIVHEASWRGVR